jgi:hypothetical protein
MPANSSIYAFKLTLRVKAAFARPATKPSLKRPKMRISAAQSSSGGAAFNYL